jgi:tRNA(adenine34) deaminase
LLNLPSKNSKLKNNHPSNFGFLFLILLILVLFNSQFFHLRSKKEITSKEEKEIIQQASQALKTLDVPVGSILLYNEEIIGEGHNTVKSDTNIAGHAEINAINDAVKKMGLQKFNKLDRDDLILVSSFEPCEMCRGAILHYNIRHVYFMKNKSAMDWNKKQLKQLRYEWHKRKIDGKHLQDSLFNLHPEYPGR